jgi:hypothetical protein
MRYDFLASAYAGVCSPARLVPNATRQARRAAGARDKRTLAAVACRVEPMVTHPAPPQTRTCAMNACGSSGKAFCYPYRSAVGVW